MENREEVEIDLLDLLYYLRKKVWIIFAAFVVAAGIGAVVTSLFMEDEYTATTRMYVLNRSSETTVSSSDYSVSNYMVNDYTILITGENVAEAVIDELNLDMSASELAGKISVEAIDSSRVMQISVVDNDAKRAANIANCVREVATEQLKAIMDVEAVNLVYEADVPEGKSGPSLVKNTALAALLGLVLVIGIFVVIYLMDDTIRTEEDVERWLGLSVLGAIPESADIGGLGGNGRGSAKSRKNSAKAQVGK